MKLTSDEKRHLKKFEKVLGYSFKKKEYLFIALTHKSFANERDLPLSENNERYEFLGDAVLELSISHILFENYPDYPEGELSKIRAASVNEVQLAEVAKSINLGEYMNLGKGEDMTGGRDKPSLLSDAYEAVLGAIYLDRGFNKAKKVIGKHFSSVLKTIGKKGFYKDYKTRLQEVSQAKFRTIPKYRLVKESGPDHRKVFEINLLISNELYGVGRGHSKKLAEQDAAKIALQKIEGK
jgi:ribonuclease III